MGNPRDSRNKASSMPQIGAQLLAHIHGHRCPSGRTGRAIGLIMEGSSRNLMYKTVPSGRGTVSVESAKPKGTVTECVNREVAETESIRNKSVPLKRHGLSGLSGQRISFKEGIRTRLASASHSPATPVGLTGRKRIGPKAEGPKSLSG